MGNLFNGNVDSTTPDNLLFDGKHPIDIKGVTLKSGQGILARGTVLGIIGLAVGAAVAGVNTGTGIIGAVALGLGARLGTYKLRCITAAANAGIFAVFAPDGSRLPDATVAVAYANSQLGFTIADGGTDFVVGDTFTISVAEGSLKAVKVNSANYDGSGVADCILTDAVDTTAADVVATAYKTGNFNRDALVFGGADTAAIHEEHLRTLGIYLKDVIPYV
jgi:hypothetical protein